MITRRSNAQEEILLLQFKHDLLEKIYSEIGTSVCKLGMQEKYEILKEIVEELEKEKPHYPPPFHLDFSGYVAPTRARKYLERGQDDNTSCS